MSPIRRFLTAFIFYPLFILWFIPKEAIRAYRKASRMNISLSIPEKIEQAKLFFNQEVKVALASRSRKPIDYSYLDQELKDIKKRNDKATEEVINKELGVTTSVEVKRGP